MKMKKLSYVLLSGLFLSACTQTEEVKDVNTDVTKDSTEVATETEPIVEEEAKLVLTNFEDYAKIADDLQTLLSSLTGSAPLREVIELFYFRVARIWFTYLPQLDWEGTVTGQLSELSELRAALECDDMRAVGQVRSVHLHRILTRIGRILAEP
mgnify:CR=1 FL=1